MENNRPGKNTTTEILSQPVVWEKTLIDISEISNSYLPDPFTFERVFFTGCGSAHYLSIWAEHLLGEKGHSNCRALPASALWLNSDIWLKQPRRALLVAFSRSGETSETINAVNTFKEKKAGKVLAVTCNPASELARIADQVIPTPAGQEQSVAQTRSFTCMMLGTLKLFMGDIPPKLPEKMRNSAEILLANYSDIATETGRDSSIQRFLILCSGRMYGLACEVMLKIKEMSLSYSEAFHFLEFRHGPMAMVDSESLVIGLHSKRTFDKEFKVLQEMQELGARTLSFGSSSEDNSSKNIMVEFPTIESEFWMDPLYLPVLQLIACERAIANHQDPDNPRNLSAVVKI
ncbi:MAG TPA: SIS domain-containing protein [Pelolinea sp.]|nr:SIS domain-containing protein [Pelolinea sp.]